MKLHTGMSAGTNRCPKCNGEMVQGFTCGREGPNRVVSTWVEGAPEKVGMLFRQVRKFRRTSAFRWGSSAVRRADSWSRTRARSSPPNNAELADFALGSDAPIALDYRQSIDCPTVIRYRWSEWAERNCWVYVAPSFSQFAEKLEL